MNWQSSIVVGLFVALLTLIAVECTELTFELEDNARQCFYEDIKKDSKGTLEFQVSVKVILDMRTDTSYNYLFCGNDLVISSNQSVSLV